MGYGLKVGSDEGKGKGEDESAEEGEDEENCDAFEGEEKVHRD